MIIPPEVRATPRLSGWLCDTKVQSESSDLLSDVGSVSPAIPVMTFRYGRYPLSSYERPAINDGIESVEYIIRIISVFFSESTDFVYSVMSSSARLSSEPVV